MVVKQCVVKQRVVQQRVFQERVLHERVIHQGLIQECAVFSCSDEPRDQLIVALRNTVGLVAVCEAHGDAIRSGRLRARAFAADRPTVGLRPVPAG